MLRKRYLISNKNDQKMTHFWQFSKWPFKRAFLKSQEKSWSLIRKKQNFSNFLIKINGNFWFFCHFYNFDFFHRKFQKSHFFEKFSKMWHATADPPIFRLAQARRDITASLPGFPKIVNFKGHFWRKVNFKGHFQKTVNFEGHFLKKVILNQKLLNYAKKNDSLLWVKNILPLKITKKKVKKMTKNGFFLIRFE